MSKMLANQNWKVLDTLSKKISPKLHNLPLLFPQEAVKHIGFSVIRELESRLRTVIMLSCWHDGLFNAPSFLMLMQGLQFIFVS